MRHFSTAFFSLFLSLAIMGCEEPQPIEPTNDDEKPVPIEFNLTGAEALLTKSDASSSGTRLSTAQSEEVGLYTIDANGKISPALQGAVVYDAFTFSGGMIVHLENGSKYIVLTDNSKYEIPEGIREYMGQNTQGDLIFSQAKIWRMETKSFEDIKTTFVTPYIDKVSGDFAIMIEPGSGNAQILNTVSGIRYNVNFCNGPRMTAINKTYAILDDCGDDIIMNVETGERTTADIVGWNSESLPLIDEALILSQTVNPGGNTSDQGYGLGRVNAEGVLTIASERFFNIGSGAINNKNNILFSNGYMAVIKELDQISMVNLQDKSTYTILEGLNVTSISLKGNLIYYLAEDNMGNPVTGTFDIPSFQPFTFDDQTKYDKVITL